MNASRSLAGPSHPSRLRSTSTSATTDEAGSGLPIIVKLIEGSETGVGSAPRIASTAQGRAARVICDPNGSQGVEALRGWFGPRLASVELSSMLPMDDRAALEKSFEESQVIILASPSRATAAVICEVLKTLSVPPEIILLDAPHPVPEELREAGIAVAFHLRGESPIERLGLAVLDTLSVHIPLREVCRRAVGKLPLREALALVRLYMLREALARTGSKRGAARELGVTRPAVQQMLRDQTPQSAAARQSEGT